MTRKISMNVSEKTDGEVRDIVDRLGLASATDAYSKSVAVLHTLLDIDSDKDGIRIVQPDGKIVRLLII